MGGDHVRPGVKVEKVTESTENQGQHRRQRRGQLDCKGVAVGNGFDGEPATSAGRVDGSQIRIIRDGLDAGCDSAGEKAEQRLPGERRAIRQRQPDAITRLCGGGGPSYTGRRQAVMRAEKGVESADALEAAGEGHADDRKARFGKQSLGQQQPGGLCQFDRRYAEFLADDAAELPRTEAEFFRQRFEAAFTVQRPRLDARGREAGGAAHRVNRRLAGR